MTDPTELLKGTTPGPFEVRECKDPEDTRFGPLWFADTSVERIAEFSSEANARLFAAAPELARELVEARDVLREVAEDAAMAERDPHFHWDRLTAIPAKARRALEAKPNGGGQ